jgi:hypothetical protein
MVIFFEVETNDGDKRLISSYKIISIEPTIENKKEAIIVFLEGDRHYTCNISFEEFKEIVRFQSSVKIIVLK